MDKQFTDPTALTYLCNPTRLSTLGPQTLTYSISTTFLNGVRTRFFNKVVSNASKGLCQTTGGRRLPMFVACSKAYAICSTPQSSLCRPTI